MHPLLKNAALARGTVTVAGETVSIRQPTVCERSEYIIERAVDHPAAMAKLLQACVLSPPLSAEEALAVANGSSDNGDPIIIAIMSLGEKKAAIATVASLRKDAPSTG